MFLRNYYISRSSAVSSSNGLFYFKVKWTVKCDNFVWPPPNGLEVVQLAMAEEKYLDHLSRLIITEDFLQLKCPTVWSVCILNDRRPSSATKPFLLVDCWCGNSGFLQLRCTSGWFCAPGPGFFFTLLKANMHQAALRLVSYLLAQSLRDLEVATTLV